MVDSVLEMFDSDDARRHMPFTIDNTILDFITESIRIGDTDDDGVITKGEFSKLPMFSMDPDMVSMLDERMAELTDTSEAQFLPANDKDEL